MNQGYNIQAFERSKHNISESANKLKNYIIFEIVVGIILVTILGITLFVVLGFTIENIENIDPNDIYQFVDDIMAAGLFTTGLIAAIFIILVGIVLAVVGILLFIQYFKLGSGFSKLHEADRTLETSKYISYGFYGYVITIIAGIFIPRTGGIVVSIIGSISLAIAAYFIYQLFNEYRNLGRYRGTVSSLLVIGLAAQAVSSIITAFTLYGGIVGLVGFFLMLIGFRDLSRDMKLVAPPGGQVVQQAVQQEGPTKVEYIPQEPSKNENCPNCGDKLSANAKFCSSCGASI